MFTCMLDIFTTYESTTNKWFSTSTRSYIKISTWYRLTYQHLNMLSGEHISMSTCQHMNIYTWQHVNTCACARLHRTNHALVCVCYIITFVPFYFEIIRFENEWIFSKRMICFQGESLVFRAGLTLLICRFRHMSICWYVNMLIRRYVDASIYWYVSCTFAIAYMKDWINS